LNAEKALPSPLKKQPSNFWKLIIMAKLRITQLRSGIGTKPNQRATLKALGLRRIRHEVVQNDSPQIRGMIAKVVHLISVEETN